MSPNHEGSWHESTHDTIERQAADWVVLRDSGFTEKQKTAFEEWLRADELHAELFAELAETWSRFDELERNDAKAASQVIRFPVNETRRRRRFSLLASVAAVAAALAVGGVIWTIRDAPIKADYVEWASTDRGATRQLLLPDGSTVQLNTDSAVAVNFSVRERRVQLVKGEARFQVAKNPARPFIVSAGRVDVKAVGTAFSVRMRPETVEVLVTEGKVRVDDAQKGESLLPHLLDTAQVPLLTAGNRVVISNLAAPVASSVRTALVSPGKVGSALDSKTQRLEFISTPLSEIVAEFNRYNEHKLVIADERLAGRRFGGTFGTTEYDEFVQVLEANFGIQVERGATTTRLSVASQESK